MKLFNEKVLVDFGNFLLSDERNDNFLNKENSQFVHDADLANFFAKNPQKSFGLSFGQAIEAVKNGAKISREGWNGKGMFVFMRPADVLDVDFIPKVKSLPDSVKEHLSKDAISGASVPFTAYLCKYAADGSIINGWLASQTDILAEDWQIVE